jgi:hypothetical protein
MNKYNFTGILRIYFSDSGDVKKMNLKATKYLRDTKNFDLMKEL